MKSFAFALIMLISSTLIAQSKKELVAQVAQLKAEIEKLKSEIVELKKPKEVEIKNGLTILKIKLQKRHPS